MATRSVLSATLRRLEGKVALITGGASGIGECTAKVFSRHGAKVVIADIQDEQGQSLCEAIGASNCIYTHCDVTKEDHVRIAVDKTVEAFGKLDIMFNNAGIVDPNKRRIVDNEKVDFECVLAVNVVGTFLGMKHAARVMVPARSGCIVSTASIAASMGGLASHAYTCSKHAVLGLTENLAVELGHFGIRVNCISPYAAATPMAIKFYGSGVEQIEMASNAMANLKGATHKVEDVADAAVYLASDEAKYVSGHNLVVDGGFTVHSSGFRFFQYPPDS